jgi:hypothetical protein
MPTQEERLTEFALQLVDVLGQGGLGQVKAPSSQREAALTSDGEKRFQLTQCHRYFRLSRLEHWI